MQGVRTRLPAAGTLEGPQLELCAEVLQWAVCRAPAPATEALSVRMPNDRWNMTFVVTIAIL